MKRNEVIVGIDGDRTHRTALYWAADEAVRRDVGLHVVHAYLSEWPETEFGLRRAQRALAPLAEEAVRAALDDVRAHAPGLPVTGAPVRSGPAAGLLDAADPGDLVVVGSRRDVAGLTATLLGSTAQQVALHSTTSVAVVRGRAGATGPVVVGIDASYASFAALGVAFAAAAARGTRLSVIRAMRPGTPAVRAALYDEIGRATSTWSEKFPEVDVERLVIPGDAATVLGDAAAHAALVVVGSRGHGGFTGMLLGSVGLHLIHHADCPVLIAR